MTIHLEQLLPGKRSGTRCLAPRRSLRKHRACTRTVAVGALRRGGKSGKNTVPFTGRLGHRPLAPGRYRATITAKAAGVTSRPATLTFKIVAG